MITLTVTPEESGLSARAWLTHHLPGAPAGYVGQLLRQGKTCRDDRPLSGDEILVAGERIVLPGSARLQQLLELSPTPPLHILYEDREVLAVVKPAGLAVHRSQGHEGDNLTLRVEALLRQRRQALVTAPAHRLDRDTTGPVLFGKGRQGIALLGRMFMTGQIDKSYLALAQGPPPARNWLDQAVPAKGKLQEARTRVLCLATSRDWSLLQLGLETGRKHQIRRQLAELGHPLAGDRRYGGLQIPGLERMFLHCRQLRLADPRDGKIILIDCPLPDDLRKILLRLGLPATL